MKVRTVAATAVILVPLLALGTGVWVATARRSSPKVVPASSGPSKIATWLAEGKATPVPAPIPLEAVAGAPVDRARVRAGIVATMQRLSYVRRRSAECKDLGPESSTEEEGRAYQREWVALRAEWIELYKTLTALAGQDPATILDLVRTAYDLPERHSLVGLIAPEIDREIEKSEGPSGPLLSGLLALATGDVEDRMHLGRFAGQLMRGNRDLGRALLNLMNDPDPNVRINAAPSLGELVRHGGLRDFLTEQIGELRNLAVLDMGPGDHVVRGGALKALAALRLDTADDFVLERFEGVQSRDDALAMILPVSNVARRLANRNESRLVAAMLRALEFPFQRDIHFAIRGMTHSLSPANREEVLRVLASRTPDPADGRIQYGYVEYQGGSGRGLTHVFRNAGDIRY